MPQKAVVLAALSENENLRFWCHGCVSHITGLCVLFLGVKGRTLVLGIKPNGN